MRRIKKVWLLVLLLLLCGGLLQSQENAPAASAAPAADLTLTVLYDNTSGAGQTTPDWGFALLVEGLDKSILFDTGTKIDILKANAGALHVDLGLADLLVISHTHSDHCGGMEAVLAAEKKIPVFMPASASPGIRGLSGRWGDTAIPVTEARPVTASAWLTGEMGQTIKEQSLIINTTRGLVILTGCSHQGVVPILEKAKAMFNRRIFLVLGGFHLLNLSEAEVKLISDRFRELGVEYCGATHCTGPAAIGQFRRAFGDHFVEAGTGRVIKISALGLQQFMPRIDRLTGYHLQ